MTLCSLEIILLLVISWKVNDCIIDLCVYFFDKLYKLFNFCGRKVRVPTA